MILTGVLVDLKAALEIGDARTGNVDLACSTNGTGEESS
jgi:hypothetical protein